MNTDLVRAENKCLQMMSSNGGAQRSTCDENAVMHQSGMGSCSGVMATQHTCPRCCEAATWPCGAKTLQLRSAQTCSGLLAGLQSVVMLF